MIQHQESLHQQALIKWKHTFMQKYPELALLHSSLNGTFMTKPRAKRAKAEGMLAGVWDLFLPVKRDVYSGLYIEMKSKTGTLTAKQKWFKGMVEQQDYKCVMCRGWTEARDALVEYLESS